MKITRLETTFIKPRWLFLKIHTDEGLVGYGEPVVEGRARTVATAVHEMEEYLIGKNPLEINKHWQILYRSTFYRGGPVLTSALSGVEQALWDIKGKYHGVPSYQLLGGPVRDRIRVYAHAHGNTVEEFVKRANEQIALGYTALKTSFEGPVREIDTLAYVKKCVNKIAAIRSGIPDHVDLAVDLHGRFTPAMAIRLAR
jgi:galactonate dehydratase